MLCEVHPAYAVGEDRTAMRGAVLAAPPHEPHVEDCQGKRYQRQQHEHVERGGQSRSYPRRVRQTVCPSAADAPGKSDHHARCHRSLIWQEFMAHHHGNGERGNRKSADENQHQGQPIPTGVQECIHAQRYRRERPKEQALFARAVSHVAPDERANRTAKEQEGK